MYDGLLMAEKVVFWFVLVWTSVTDARTRTIPNAAIALGLGARVACCTFARPNSLPVALGSGAALVLPALLLVVLICRARGNVGLGGGDLKLLFVVGCYLGVVPGAVALSLGCAGGVLFCLLRRVQACDAADAEGFPLAPFLAVGCLGVV